VVRQTLPALYALGETRMPVIVSLIDLGAFIVLALRLRDPLGHVGISVAVAGSSAVQMGLLLWGLKFRLGTICGAELLGSAARTATASTIAAAAGWAAARLAAISAGSAVTSAARAAPGLAGMTVFGAVFLLGAWGMRSPELEELLNAARRKLRRTR